jgi:hypothetical protein
MRSSTITTKEAMITIKDAIRTWGGINFLKRDTNRLEKTSTKVVASPIPIPFMPVVVTASVGQSPKTNRKGGRISQNPLVNSVRIDIKRSPF